MTDDTFSSNHLENLKKVLSNVVDFVEEMRESDCEGIHVLIKIEDMQELTSYCKELGIMDKVILHDESDRDRILKEKGLVLCS